MNLKESEGNNMNVNEKIGKIIRNARLDKRMTMKDLAKLIGYSEVAMHNYEMG